MHLLPGLPDTSRVEGGIDAVPEGDLIRLEWLSSPEEDVVFYEVFKSHARVESFVQIAKVTAPDTSWQDGDVVFYEKNYYYVTSLTDEDYRSDPSDTLEYTLVPKVIHLAPSGAISDARPVFSWDEQNEHTYVIRLLESSTLNPVWIAKASSQYQDRVSVQFNFDGRAAVDSLERGKDYQWRVDVSRPEASIGSESEWSQFQIQ
ncbi:hypothetical protein JW906_10785 [bacterium]|nr:hypothetical protein [bacterium]